jgi:hypothetical protein
VGITRCAAVVVALLPTAAGCSDGPRDGTVAGTLNIAPGGFKCLLEPCVPLPTDGEVVIRGADGGEVDRIAVGESGAFEVSLEVGTYTVQSVFQDGESARDLVCEEERVNVVEGVTANVSLACPTL